MPITVYYPSNFRDIKKLVKQQGNQRGPGTLSYPRTVYLHRCGFSIKDMQDLATWLSEGKLADGTQIFLNQFMVQEGYHLPSFLKPAFRFFDWYSESSFLTQFFRCAPFNESASRDLLLSLPLTKVTQVQSLAKILEIPTLPSISIQLSALALAQNQELARQTAQILTTAITQQKRSREKRLLLDIIVPEAERDAPEAERDTVFQQWIAGLKSAQYFTLSMRPLPDSERKSLTGERWQQVVSCIVDGHFAAGAILALRYLVTSGQLFYLYRQLDMAINMGKPPAQQQDVRVCFYMQLDRATTDCIRRIQAQLTQHGITLDIRPTVARYDAAQSNVFWPRFVEAVSWREQHGIWRDKWPIIHAVGTIKCLGKGF